MAEISRRRADQLGNFVRVLKLGAVDLDDRVRVAEQNFRGRFDDARLSRTGRPEKQHRADRPIGRVHAGEKNLVEAAHAPHCAFLADDASLRRSSKSCARGLF